mgnify:CR=1 FL=1
MKDQISPIETYALIDVSGTTPYFQHSIQYIDEINIYPIEYTQ